MAKIMFDSNAFDKMQKDIPRLKNANLEFYVTDIQIKEILSIPNDKRKVRVKNGYRLYELQPKIVCAPFSFDRVNFAKFAFSPEEKYWEVLKESKANINDALIAAAAYREGCILVTDDKELSRKIQEISARAMTYSEFIAEYFG